MYSISNMYTEECTVTTNSVASYNVYRPHSSLPYRCHMCYVCCMRRQFEVRARLVLYLEQADLNALTALAREEGRTLVDWARNELIERLKPAVKQGKGIGATPEKRHKPRTRSTIRAIEDVAHEVTRKTAGGMVDVPRIPERAGMCPHHHAAGELCYKRDGKLGWPAIG
jgi:hypothetical protein